MKKPKTVEEAVNRMLDVMLDLLSMDEDVELKTKIDKDEFRAFLLSHIGYEWISDNQDLQKDLNRIIYGKDRQLSITTDDALDIIIREMWKKLEGKDLVKRQEPINCCLLKISFFCMRPLSSLFNSIVLIDCGDKVHLVLPIMDEIEKIKLSLKDSEKIRYMLRSIDPGKLEDVCTPTLDGIDYDIESFDPERGYHKCHASNPHLPDHSEYLKLIQTVLRLTYSYCKKRASIYFLSDFFSLNSFNFDSDIEVYVLKLFDRLEVGDKKWLQRVFEEIHPFHYPQIVDCSDLKYITAEILPEFGRLRKCKNIAIVADGEIAKEISKVKFLEPLISKTKEGTIYILEDRHIELKLKISELFKKGKIRGTIEHDRRDAKPTCRLQKNIQLMWGLEVKEVDP
jgi:hypothetical protein